jgi:ERCC4-type nuclease
MKITKPACTRRKLPAMLLSDPGATPPTAIVDTREQAPLQLDLQTVVMGLTSGDYSFVGGVHLFSIERKSLDDLVGCVTRERERFERELIRLRGYRFRRLLIVGTPEELEAGRYVSATPPAAIFSSLATWEVRFDVPVVFAATPELAGDLVSSWIRAFARELARDAMNMAAGMPGATQPRQPKIRQEAA